MAARYSCLRSDVACGLLILTGRGLRSHLAPSLQLLLSIGDNLVPSLQARRDNHSAALGKSNLHWPHLHGIVVVEDIAIRTVGSTENGAGWRGNGILTRFQEQVNVDELVRPEAVIRVVKDGLQLGCSRCLVDLIVDG